MMNKKIASLAKKALWVLVPSLLLACQTTGSAQSQANLEQNDARSVETHTKLGFGYYSLGKYGIALDEAKIALQGNPKYGPAHNLRGLIYMTLKENDEAESSFQQALKYAPEDSDIQHNYGSFLCGTKREEQSVKYFLAALKNPLYPSPERSLANAGLCLKRIGKSQDADQYLSMAVKQAPEDAIVLINLAEVRFDLQDYEVSSNYLARYHQLKNVSPSSLMLGYKLAMRRDDKTRAKEFADQLLLKYPDSKQADVLRATNLPSP